MKLKFEIKKNGQTTHTNTVGSQAEGDAWVEQTKLAFGVQDRAYRLEQLEEHGLTPEAASSTTEMPALGEQPAYMVYNFPKDWSVVVEDITAVDTYEKKKDTKQQTRIKCNEIFDDVAISNEAASDATMDAIFLNPAFMAIIGALVSGAPKTAKRYVQSLGPSLYSEAKVAEIVAKLDAIITASEGV